MTHLGELDPDLCLDCGAHPTRCRCEPGHYDQHDAWHPLGSRCTCTPPDQRVTRRTGRLAAQEQWLRDHPDAVMQSHAERVTRPSDQRVTRVESDATSWA
jgi:hypothetical protein